MCRTASYGWLWLTLIMLGSPIFGQDSETTPMPGQQVELSFTASDDGEVPYLLYLPQEYEASDALGAPVLLFLHGRGESRGPLSLVAKWGPPRLAARGDALPYIIVSPQCPNDDSWSSDTQQQRIRELLDEILKTYNVNSKEVYLTGLSMGGYGSWRLAAEQPERFAAAVIICGGGDPKDAEQLKELPIWVFHGDQDKAVAYQKSVEMVEAIEAAGGDQIRFTSMEHVGHNCWSAAYATPQIYDWLSQHKRR